MQTVENRRHSHGRRNKPNQENQNNEIAGNRSKSVEISKIAEITRKHGNEENSQYPGGNKKTLSNHLDRIQRIP